MYYVVLMTVKNGFEHLTDAVAATAQHPDNQCNMDYHGLSLYMHAWERTITCLRIGKRCEFSRFSVNSIKCSIRKTFQDLKTCS